jgi:hypothetical protein
MHTPKSKKSEGNLSDQSQKIEGKYANYFKIGHNAFEFIFDFGQIYSENDRAELNTRVITTPVYAKALLETLQDAITRYEKTIGKIGKDTNTK